MLLDGRFGRPLTSGGGGGGGGGFAVAVATVDPRARRASYAVVAFRVVLLDAKAWRDKSKKEKTSHTVDQDPREEKS